MLYGFAHQTLRYCVTSVDLTCNFSETLLVTLERQGYAMDSRRMADYKYGYIHP